MTTEILFLRATQRGLCLSDFENMTIGMVVDIIITYNNEHLDEGEEEEEEDVRMATQADFDRW